MRNICPDCGDSYERLAMHWTRSECARLEFTDEQCQIVNYPCLLAAFGGSLRQGA